MHIYLNYTLFRKKSIIITRHLNLINMNSITHDQELATANQNMYNTMITPSSLIYDYAPFIETNSAAGTKNIKKCHAFTRFD